MRSVTHHVTPLKIPYKNNLNNEDEVITIVDTPGFGDTDCVEVDIYNTLGIVRSAMKAKLVHPVLLFSQKN